MLDVQRLVLDIVSVGLQLCFLLVIVQLSGLRIGLDQDARAGNATVGSGVPGLQNVTQVVQGVVDAVEGLQ